MTDYTAHEYADLFPMMGDDEFASLVEDVRRKGQIESIVLFKGQILDGRNRYKACKQLGIEPRYKQFSGNDQQALEAVLSWNLERRHLSSSQKAAISVELVPLFDALEEQAKGRQLRTAENREKASLVNQKFEKQESHNERSTAHKAAAAMGTNRQYISDAKKLKDNAPEVLEQVKAGAINISEAKQIAKLAEGDRQQVLTVAEKTTGDKKAIKKALSDISRQQRIEKISEIAKGNSPLDQPTLFPVLYADPPWRYEHVKTESRAIENQYPTMTLDEICALPISTITTDDAILFLWATSPKLAESMQVIESWGFTYRTCAVWAKDKIGMGYYFRQQHELLLICTRGSIPAPPVEARVSSLVYGDRTEHSKKPDKFAEIIEAMYPDLPKLELFCRTPRDGWHVWGNQSQGGAA